MCICVYIYTYIRYIKQQCLAKSREDCCYPAHNTGWYHSC